MAVDSDIDITETWRHSGHDHTHVFNSSVRTSVQTNTHRPIRVCCSQRQKNVNL